MVQARGPWHDRTFRPGVQDHELASRGAHADLRPVAGKRRQADVVAVEAQRLVRVGDGEIDGAHPGGRGDRLNLHLRRQTRWRVPSISRGCGRFDGSESLLQGWLGELSAAELDSLVTGLTALRRVGDR